MTGVSTTAPDAVGARIGAVVPVLNEAGTIESALAALACAHERIVVDGGSDDATRALADATGARVIGAERGRASQMNAGAALAVSEVLVFVHADTRLPPDWCDRVRDALRDEARRWGRFDVELDDPGLLLRVVGWAMNLRSRLTGICTGDQAIFVRRDAFEEVGGFAPIALMEDIELSGRLRRRYGRPVALTARVRVSARRWRRDGILRTILRMWIYRSLYWFGASPDRLHELYYGARR